MPLVEYNIYPDKSECAIWHLQEDIEHFLEELDLDPEEEKEFNKILVPSKRKQWLGVRYLVHKMSGRVTRGMILKTNNGFPRLEKSKFNISLSHSEDYVAAAAAPYPIGVDIQVKNPAIMRILDKFTNECENAICREHPDGNLAHLIWSAKEGMFKAYGKGNVDFRKHLSVKDPDQISPTKTEGVFYGELNKPDEEPMIFKFVYQNTEDHVFVLAKNIL